MRANGYTADFAERVFRQIRGFGEYGFPESHAASFALLVYVSAWLKHHFPAVFTAALLNSQPMGFYAPAQLVADARQHGVPVRPVDVNASAWDCCLEAAPEAAGQYALRLGLRMIDGLPQSQAQRLVAARGATPFADFDDFARRTQLPPAVLKRLARADALASLGLSRREALWQALVDPRTPPLLQAAQPSEPAVDLPAMPLAAEVAADYRTVHLSLRGHPLQFIRPRLQQRQVVLARQLPWLPTTRRCQVAGLVLMRQRPGTARGITFVTLEDETGTVNLIIRPEVWQRYRQAALGAAVLLARGQLQRERRVIHVLVEELEDISHWLRDIASRSRDFH
jgi:error-prone DNA polymerase